MGDAAPYRKAADALMTEHHVIVKLPYRKSTTGRAYISQRMILTPDPRGPISFGTFAHEVGHVALGHSSGKPRWVEETEAWEFAMRAFIRFGLRGYERAHADAGACLAYSYSKAIRRGVAPAVIEAAFPSWWSDALAHDRHSRLRNAVVYRALRGE